MLGNNFQLADIKFFNVAEIKWLPIFWQEIAWRVMDEIGFFCLCPKGQKYEAPYFIIFLHSRVFYARDFSFFVSCWNSFFPDFWNEKWGVTAIFNENFRS